MENTKKGTTFVEVDGDAIELFFTSSENAIFMHGANCQKVMGAGIANQVRTKISPLFYLDQYDTRTPSQRFGSYSAVVLAQAEDNIKVGANIYSQYTPGKTFDLGALRNGLKSFTFSIPKERREEMTVYLPKIGTGIGGGNWEEIEPVIKKELSQFNIVVVNYVNPETKKKEE